MGIYSRPVMELQGVIRSSQFPPPSLMEVTGSFTYRLKTGNGDGHGNFGFKVNDGTADSEEATVTVNVTKINDAATAIAQTVNADEDIDKNHYPMAGTDVQTGIHCPSKLPHSH